MRSPRARRMRVHSVWIAYAVAASATPSLSLSGAIGTPLRSAVSSRAAAAAMEAALTKRWTLRALLLDFHSAPNYRGRKAVLSDRTMEEIPMIRRLARVLGAALLVPAAALAQGIELKFAA